jgi:putative flippase GtrA
MILCDFGGYIYKGNLVKDLYLMTLKQNKKLIKHLGTMLKEHFLFILGRRGKSRLSLRMFDCLCAHKERDVFIREFWEKHKKKLRPIPEGATIISIFPYDIIAPVCAGHRVIALEDLKKEYNTKAELLLDKIPNPDIKTYYYGNTIDDSLISISETVITPTGEVFVRHKKSFKRMFFVREFLMYAMIGGINTLCGVVCAYTFSLILPPMVAFVIGYVIFLVLSYILNTKLTFRQSFGLVKFFKFCVAYLPSFVIQFLLAGVLISAFGHARFIVYVLTVVAGIPATFIVMRVYSFAKSKVTPMQHSKEHEPKKE